MQNRAVFERVEDKGWGNLPLVIVGTGPSLRGTDLSLLDRPDLRVLAVKEAVFDLPFAAECVCIHGTWLKNRLDALLAQPVPITFVTDNVFNPPYLVRDEFHYIERRHADGLSNDPRYVNHGGTSGYAALNVATLRGARRILLMGFDYGTLTESHARTGHHYRDEAYPWYLAARNGSMWAGWAKNFKTCANDLRALGAEVHNANPGGLVDAFPRATLDEFMRRRAA